MKLKAKGRHFLWLAIFLGAGCQPISIEKVVDLKPGLSGAIIITAPKYEQNVTVTIQSTTCPVDAYVVKEEEHEEARVELDSGRKPRNPFGSELQIQEGSFTATIPAKQEYAVVVGNHSKATSVTIKVKGK